MNGQLKPTMGTGSQRGSVSGSILLRDPSDQLPVSHVGWRLR